jgi:biotin carboxyl carrier protein
MRYYVTLSPDSKPMEIEVTELPSGALEVKMGGKPVDVDVLAVGPSLSIRVGGRVVDLTTEGMPPELGAVASGHRSYVRVESERMRAASAARQHERGTTDRVVRSPMPGRVVKVCVAVGDAIEVGQPLVVVEAMKMENELKAKASGRVLEIHVEAGAAVEGNAKLITLA